VRKQLERRPSVGSPVSLLHEVIGVAIEGHLISTYGEAEEDEFAICSEDPRLLVKGGMWNVRVVEAEVRKVGRTCR
jgi:hypothetical protein